MATAEMTAPKGEAIPIENLPPRTNMVTMPDGLMAAINKEAGVEPAAVTPAAPVVATPSATPPATPAAKAAATPAPAATPAAAATPAPPKKEGVKELREAYERAQAKVDELNASVTATTKEKAEALTKLAKAEEQFAVVQKRIAEEFEPQVKRLTEVEKRLQEREERLRIADYQASDEYHERYVRPLASARAEAEAFMGELTVATADGQERQATKADLDTVLSQPNHTQAAKLAKALFGEETYQSVLNHRMKVLSLERSRQEAVKNAHLASAEWLERTQSQQAQAQAQFRSALTASMDKMFAEHPEIFTAAEDDADAKGALDEGASFGEELLNLSPATPPEQIASKVAQAQVRVRAYPRLRQTIGRQAAEITNLKKQLAEFQRSEPDVATRTGGVQAQVHGSGKEAAMASLDAAIAAIAK